MVCAGEKYGFYLVPGTWYFVYVIHQVHPYHVACRQYFHCWVVVVGMWDSALCYAVRARCYSCYGGGYGITYSSNQQPYPKTVVSPKKTSIPPYIIPFIIYLHSVFASDYYVPRITINTVDTINTWYMTAPYHVLNGCTSSPFSLLL